MKVGEETADDLEFVAWAEEDAGLAGMGRQRLAVGNLSAVLKRPSCGGMSAMTMIQSKRAPRSSSGPPISKGVCPC